MNFCDNETLLMIFKKYTADPVLARNPFVLEDEEWKVKRSEITPGFTPNRMKALFSLIDDVTARLTTYIHSQLKKTKEPFDTKNLCEKFTADAVASCIFAIDAESFTNEKSELRDKGMRLIDFPISVIISIILYAAFPFLKKVFKLPIVPKDVEQFFIDLMDQALKIREDSKSDRDDYLAYLISLKKKKQIESIDMAAHAVSFFVDGFATSSVAITNALYEISKDNRVQEKLRQEIKESIAQNGSATFDSINNMEYLDQVFNETLRLHPPAPFTVRVCNEEIEVEGMKGTKLLIEKGQAIYIPILQVHLDPENFENPDKFYPERFDDGAVKDYKDKSVFLPFGQGPRACLGMRFAITQSKAAIVEILRNFEIIANKKTLNPQMIDPKEILNIKLGGSWIDFKPIDKI